MSWLAKVLWCCVSDGVPRRSLLTALVVGTILNLINQGDALVTGGHVVVPKLLLTYCVPFCVSTFGAVSLRLKLMRGKASLAGAGDGRTTP
ncbi:MAG TPA: nitrate/nitrite transporter NrtS [Stellaceae bacterium]|nr:nitrate/nitrite transporter NrtS [Stellaceae bacterium]